MEFRDRLQLRFGRILSKFQNAFFPDPMFVEGYERYQDRQKQMISLARAIIKNPDLLILDEATSHLDGIRASLIQDIVKTNFKDKTCIIISHRLSSVALADKYLVYDCGKIVQQRKYKELINSQGQFKELFHVQNEIN